MEVFVAQHPEASYYLTHRAGTQPNPLAKRYSAMKTYSNKSNARRAALKAGVNLDNVTFVQNSEGWYWEDIQLEVAVATAIAEVDTTAEDAALELVAETHAEPTQALPTHCPHCGINLENGYSTYEAQCEKGMERISHEFVCLGCGEEFGQEVVASKKSAKETGTGLKIERNREERNGIKRPSIGGKCRQVWDACDSIYNNGKGLIPMPKQLKEWATANGHNPNNAVIELYQWRKFMGFKGR